MKITNEDKKLLKEAHSRWLNENYFLGRLFLKKVASAIRNDAGIQNAIDTADKELKKTRDKIEKLSNDDKEKVKNAIPADVRKYLGFDY
jgi:serine protease inhibitor